MQQIDSVIFDLDGTLWDTCATCAAAWNNVLKRREIPFREITSADLAGISGKSHEAAIREVFAGLSEEHVQVLIQDTIEEDNLLVEQLGGHLYEGVESGLQKLKEHYPLFIVSNCQSGYIETFLRFSGLTDLFSDIECWGNTKESKSKNVARVIQRNKLASPIYMWAMGKGIGLRPGIAKFLSITLNTALAKCLGVTRVSPGFRNWWISW